MHKINETTPHPVVVGILGATLCCKQHNTIMHRDDTAETLLAFECPLKPEKKLANIRFSSNRLLIYHTYVRFSRLRCCRVAFRRICGRAALIDLVQFGTSQSGLCVIVAVKTGGGVAGCARADRFGGRVTILRGALIGCVRFGRIVATVGGVEVLGDLDQLAEGLDLLLFSVGEFGALGELLLGRFAAI
jgi:hypothetical protein